jgi:hypothetical protein
VLFEITGGWWVKGNTMRIIKNHPIGGVIDLYIETLKHGWLDRAKQDAKLVAVEKFFFFDILSETHEVHKYQ